MPATPLPMVWEAFPPEVWAALVEAGPGPEGWLAAAAAYQNLAAVYSAHASELEGVLARIAAQYQGPSAAQFQMLHQLRVAWHAEAALKHEVAAGQHMTLVAAHASLQAGLPHSPELVENHATHGALEGSNFCGCNAAPIGANEGDYARMWTQSGSEMRAYEGATGSAIDFLVPSEPLPGMVLPGVSEAVAAGAEAEGAATIGEAAIGGAGLAAVDAYTTGEAGREIVVDAPATLAAHAPNPREESPGGGDSGDRMKDGQMMGQGAQMFSQVPQMLSQVPQMFSQAPQMMGQAPQMLSQAPQMMGQAPQMLSQLISQFGSGGANDIASTGQFGFSGSAPIAGLSSAGVTRAAGGAVGTAPTSMVPSSWSARAAGPGATAAVAEAAESAEASRLGAGAGASGVAAPMQGRSGAVSQRRRRSSATTQEEPRQSA